MNHPWKDQSFNKHLKEQKHLKLNEYDESMANIDIWNSTHQYDSNTHIDM